MYLKLPAFSSSHMAGAYSYQSIRHCFLALVQIHVVVIQTRGRVHLKVGMHAKQEAVPITCNPVQAQSSQLLRCCTS